MDHCHSHILEISCADRSKFDLWSTSNVRIHRDAATADNACKILHADWQHYVTGNTNNKRIGGSISPLSGNFTAIGVPECIPERLAFVSKVYEWGMTFDDIGDSASSESLSNKGSLSLEAQRRRQEFLRSRQLFAMYMLEIYDDHGEAAEKMLSNSRAFTTFLKENHDRLLTVEELLMVRMYNAAWSFVTTLAEWGLGLNISKCDMQAVEWVLLPYYQVMLIRNDYDSWEKEQLEPGKSSSIGRASNVIDIFMMEGKVDFNEARAQTRELAAQKLREANCRRDRLMENKAHYNSDVLRFVEAIVLMEAGYEFWSATTPRYHLPSEELPAHQQPTHTELRDDKMRSGSCGEETISSCFVANQEMLPRDVASYSEIQKNTRTSERALTAMTAPSEYIGTLPSKNVRGVLLEAFCAWISLPQDSHDLIEKSIDMLHNSSLLLDDVEDSSPLRRGQPAAHIIFGVAQTVNSANSLFVAALREVRRLRCPQAIDICLQELEYLHEGQALDLNWTHDVHCPSKEDYLQMIDNKTGGLIRLMLRLMVSESAAQGAPEAIVDEKSLLHLGTLIGRYYQLRDDLINITSSDYAETKGEECTDMDEGKCTILVVCCLTKHPEYRKEVVSCLGRLQSQCNDQITASVRHALKQRILGILHKTDSFSCVQDLLSTIHDQILDKIVYLEQATGIDNPLLRLLIKRLERPVKEAIQKKRRVFDHREAKWVVPLYQIA